MIAPSSAWVRVSLRRIPNTPSPRNGNTGTPSPFEHTRFRFNPHTSRRYNAPRPNAGQINQSAQTIPGPSWLWLEPIVEPFRAYGRVQQRKPYMTQLISSLVIYFVGDLVAQSISPTPTTAESLALADDAEEKGWVQEWSNNRDWARTGRALVIGGLSSIPSYRWFLWLSNNFNYSSKLLSITTKVTINQAFFTPLFNSYFFGMQSLLSGASGTEIVERIKNTVPTSWLNSCKVWPAITAFSFTYIPLQYRSIFGGVIAIGWQTYLSLLNQRAAAKEENGAEAEHVPAVKTRAVETRAEHGHGQQKCPM
ncbi:Mpv17-PMP22 domain containing protein [Pyrenophora teres f. maculata]|nr:Mpv17-PMP22 domain containing protein [Pyrenophora teres f. maculata]